MPNEVVLTLPSAEHDALYTLAFRLWNAPAPRDELLTQRCRAICDAVTAPMAPDPATNEWTVTMSPDAARTTLMMLTYLYDDIANACVENLLPRVIGKSDAKTLTLLLRGRTLEACYDLAAELRTEGASEALENVISRTLSAVRTIRPKPWLAQNEQVRVTDARLVMALAGLRPRSTRIIRDIQHITAALTCEDGDRAPATR